MAVAQGFIGVEVENLKIDQICSCRSLEFKWLCVFLRLKNNLCVCVNLNNS